MPIIIHLRVMSNVYMVTHQLFFGVAVVLDLQMAILGVLIV